MHDDAGTPGPHEGGTGTLGVMGKILGKEPINEAEPLQGGSELSRKLRASIRE